MELQIKLTEAKITKFLGMNVQIRTFLPFHYDSLTKISDVLKENLPQKIENVEVFSNYLQRFFQYH